MAAASLLKTFLHCQVTKQTSTCTCQHTAPGNLRHTDDISLALAQQAFSAGCNDSSSIVSMLLSTITAHRFGQFVSFTLMLCCTTVMQHVSIAIGCLIKQQYDSTSPEQSHQVVILDAQVPASLPNVEQRRKTDRLPSGWARKARYGSSQNHKAEAALNLPPATGISAVRKKSVSGHDLLPLTRHGHFGRLTIPRVICLAFHQNLMLELAAACCFALQGMIAC